MYRDHLDFDGRVLVTHRLDGRSGLNALIAIPDETCGPAMCGCRILNYAAPDQAIEDVLRLSRGMTHKNAIANILEAAAKR